MSHKIFILNLNQKYKWPSDVCSAEEPIFRNGENIDNQWTGNFVSRRVVSDAEAQQFMGKYFISEIWTCSYQHKFLDQGQPFFTMRLKPEFWADRSRPWHEHFVTVAKRMPNNSICHLQVPISPMEYTANPVVWPRGVIGELFLIWKKMFLVGSSLVML